MLPKTAFSSEDEYLANLRDWFAGQALSVLGALGTVQRRGHETQAEADARYAYERADALLAERAKGGDA